MLNMKPFTKWFKKSQNSGEKATTHKENYSNEPHETNYFHQAKGTPFFISGNEEKGYIGIMGKYQITETFKTPGEVENYINACPWELLITVMQCTFTYLQTNQAEKPPMTTEQATHVATKEDGDKIMDILN